MVDAGEFEKVFQHGFLLVPVDDDGDVNPYPLSAVSMNADGSLQVRSVQDRQWNVTVESTDAAKWMVRIPEIGRAALRPLSEAQSKRLFVGDADAVPGEGEQPG